MDPGGIGRDVVAGRQLEGMDPDVVAGRDCVAGRRLEGMDPDVVAGRDVVAGWGLEGTTIRRIRTSLLDGNWKGCRLEGLDPDGDWKGRRLEGSGYCCWKGIGRIGSGRGLKGTSIERDVDSKG